MFSNMARPTISVIWYLSNPKFSDFAQSCGMTGLRAENNVEVEAKMKELFQTEGPALLEVITDPDKM